MPTVTVNQLTKTYSPPPFTQFLRNSSSPQFSLQDISFQLQKGEVLGIIGPNGSGKSTLLKLLAGVTKPDSGTLHISGKLVPLIELGAGFNPELTGEENIYLNATILGLSKAEITRHYQAITNFANLGHYLNQPLKKYSSGMYLRLAFAIAAFAQPDVILIDEILAVGDEEFQRRCLRTLDQFKIQGTTIIFVSHAINTVRSFCNRVLYLRHGHQVAIGPAEQVCDQYLQDLSSAHSLENPPDADVAFHDRLFSPTFVTKINQTYYLVDCWHHRVLYNANLIDRISHWQTLTDKISYPHSIATDQDILVIESSDQRKLFVFSVEDHRLLQKLTLPQRVNRPHRLRYDPYRQLFYCLTASSQDFIILQKDPASRKLRLLQTISLDFLNGYYCRSFSFDLKNPVQLYFVAGSDHYDQPNQQPAYQPKNAQIIQTVFIKPDDPRSKLQVIRSFPVPQYLANMNDLFQTRNYFYLTATPKQLARVKKLTTLSKHPDQIEDLYDRLNLKGTPYYLEMIDQRLYIPEINEHSRLTSCKLLSQDQIADVKHQYDFGPPNQASINRRALKTAQSMLNSSL